MSVVRFQVQPIDVKTKWLSFATSLAVGGLLLERIIDDEH
jgi:hypothetical protein